MMNRNSFARWGQVAGLAPAMLGAALFAGCGSDTAATTTTTPNEDAVSAYQALSAQLQQCDDALQSCLAMANGDATAEADCNAAAADCQQNTQGAETHAHQCLAHDAQGCFRGAHHHCSADADGGVDEGGGICRSQMHDCMQRHAPQVPKCVQDMMDCMSQAQPSAAGTGAGETDVSSCVKQAHACFMDNMRHHRPDAHHTDGAAGEGAAGGDPSPGPRAHHTDGAAGEGAAGGDPGPGPRAGSGPDGMFQGGTAGAPGFFGRFHFGRGGRR